jgi:tetratricopeptide (TPR) repeat protein
MKTLRFTIHVSRFTFPFILILVLVRPIHAQNILLKTGQTIETKGVRRSGDMVMGKVQVGASSGEVGYQAATIAKIDFPEPPQLKTTAAFLSQGQPEKALADIEPVVKYYAPFRDLPGNWWAQAALLKIAALGGMQLDKQAEALGEELRQSVTDPETARAAQLQLVAGLVRKEDYAKALQLCDAVITESAQPAVLAEAWVRKGDALLAQRQWDGAVLAYLHVPVFYEDEKLWMPPAFLGSARAFRGLEDLERAKRSLNDLTAGYPKSAQAEIARAELQKLPK